MTITTFTHMDNFYNKLYSLQDLKYKEFHQKLIKKEIIGIRTPKLKEIAKNISKHNYIEYINNCEHKYYEDTIIHGLIITYLNSDFNEIIKLFDDFIPYIDNWATCDIVVGNFKIFKKNKEVGYKKIVEYVNSNNEFEIRVGLVLLLNYYIEPKYLNDIFKICDSINNKKYYCKMAIAWLISICYIKYPTETYKYLLNNKLDKWTYNKAISKIVESNRISNKEEIKKLKQYS